MFAAAGSVAANRSDWVALECPYIASPLQTACQLPFAAVCPYGNASCGCLPGYQNRRCTECEVGYFSSARACRLCNPVLQYLPIAWTIVVIAYAAYLLLVPGSASGVLKVLVFFGQSLLLLVQNARVPWPEGLRHLLEGTATTGSLSATALECVSPGISMASRYGVYTGTPMLLLVVCAAVYVVQRLRGAEGAYDKLVYMSLSMLMTTYFSVSIKALSGFSCTLTDGYLNAYPWIECSVSRSTEFPVILALSVVCFVVYTVGVPLVSAYQLFKHRSSLGSDPAIATRLGFLYGPYRPGCFWWEYVVILRRLVLALAITLVPFTQQQLESAIVMAVLVVSVALQHAFEPFATRLENRLEMLSLYTLLLSFLGVYVSETSTASAAGTLQWLPVAVIVLTAVVAAVLAVMTVLVLVVRLLPKFANTRIGSALIRPDSTLLSVQRELQRSLLDAKADDEL